jgi:hypothetical protein
MKLFIKKFFFGFILPSITLIIFLVIWDPFNVFFINNDECVNRETNCLNILKSNKNNVSNFIVGNSRSLAYKTDYWAKKLKVDPTTCFHYDGSGAGLYRVTNAIRFLKECHEVENILLILDVEMLYESYNPQTIWAIQPPEVSGESSLDYYFIFFKASMDPKFIFSKIVYFFSGQYFDFMGFYIPTNKEKSEYNKETADLSKWSYDKLIQKDSLGYYLRIPKMYELFIRANKEEISEAIIQSKQYDLLKKLSETVKKEKAKIKIIISPLYNQLAINDADKRMLTNLFGVNNVYDFSGKNIITDNKSNYYERSHYKPYVANLIMDSVYSASYK